MTISAFKKHLHEVDSIRFIQADGQPVPAHFHITEAGVVTKNFIDCGGTVREEVNMSLQIWVAQDTDHRLAPTKLLGIIAVAEKLFGNHDLEVEAEYQTGGSTVGRYGLDYQNGDFVLTIRNTDCLAKDSCGIPVEMAVAGGEEVKAICTPGGGCC